MSSKRVAVVTGAAGGLGESMCKALCEQGRAVVASYLLDEQEQAREWQDRMKSEGCEVEIFALDVSDFDSCQHFIDQVEEHVGPIDILVNNAGITRDAPLKRMGPEQWQAVMRTNLDSMFNMCQPLFDRMCSRGWGRIVNISSLNGEKGQFGQAN